MTKPRSHSDGTLHYPRRGKPPSPLPGYYIDPKDPYILIPDFIPCKFRELTPILKPCGEFRCAYTCKIKNNREVNYLFCESCDDAQE